MRPRGSTEEDGFVARAQAVEGLEMADKKCPKCGAEDRDYGRLLGNWGAPVRFASWKGWLSGLFGGGDAISAYVCPKCGHVELVLTKDL